jgi:hypothetical protein
MGQTDAADRWVPVARETFEYNMIPWVGRRHAPWLRAWARPHPVDPRGLVLVPERIYRVFSQRALMEPVTRQQLAAMGYPRLPAEGAEQ